MTKASSKYVKYGIIGAGVIVAVYIGFVIGEEVAFSNSIKTLANQLMESHRGKELLAGYIDMVDIKIACALGKELGLPSRNVGTYENFQVRKSLKDNIEYLPTGPKVVKFVHCDTKEEVLAPASWRTVYEHSDRLNYEIPFKLDDGLYTILFYADEDASPRSQLPISGIMNIKMKIREVSEFVEAGAIGDIPKQYIKAINFTDGGIFGTISVTKDGEVISVPKGTKVILEASSNPEAPLQSFALTNERGEFVLAEPIVPLNFFDNELIREIYPQGHTLRIVLPNGEEYLYELGISEEDHTNVKLWYMGLLTHPQKIYDGRLVYRVDLVL